MLTNRTNYPVLHDFHVTLIDEQVKCSRYVQIAQSHLSSSESENAVVFV